MATVVTLCWLGEALVLVALAKAGSHAAMRIFATAVLTVAALSLLVDWIAGTPQPLAVVANMHFATNLIGAAVFAMVTRLSLGGGPGAALAVGPIWPAFPPLLSASRCWWPSAWRFTITGSAGRASFATSAAAMASWSAAPLPRDGAIAPGAWLMAQLSWRWVFCGAVLFCAGRRWLCSPSASRRFS